MVAEELGVGVQQLKADVQNAVFELGTEKKAKRCEDKTGAPGSRKGERDTHTHTRPILIRTFQNFKGCPTEDVRTMMGSRDRKPDFG